MSDNISMGSHSVYIENADNIVINCGVTPRVVDVRQLFADISQDLRGWRHTLSDGYFIPRPQTTKLIEWIESDISEAKERVALLVGGAGSGKSVVLREVLCQMEQRTDILTLSLKSDQIDFTSIEDLFQRMHVDERPEAIIRTAASKYRRLVLIVDQIDALSLSLSSNRGPLRSILRFVENLKSIDNIRIVISCRQYDLEYDPVLEGYRFGQRVEMDLLDIHVVKTILLERNFSKISDSSSLFNTLRTPLYLYLFIKIASPSTDVDNTMTAFGLYDLLWKQITTEIPEGVSIDSLLELLDSISTEMYARQNLSISRRSIDSRLNSTLNYLLSKEYLVQVSSDRVQFFHQSLFDYVYARRFVEKGDDICSQLKNEHQGLFVRARVKAILGFLRDSDIDKFVWSVRTILFEIDSNDRPSYRYHLRLLVLSLMGYHTNLHVREISLVKNETLKNDDYKRAFIRGIRTPEWFEIINNLVSKGRLWTSMSEDDVQLMADLSSKMIYDNQQLILNYWDENFAPTLPHNVIRRVLYAITNIRPNEECISLIESLYDKLYEFDEDCFLPEVLNRILEYDPQYVILKAGECLHDIVVASQKSEILYDIDLPHHLSQLFEAIRMSDINMSFAFFSRALIDMCEVTRYVVTFEDHFLVHDHAFMYYEPISSPRFTSYKFPSTLLSVIVQDVSTAINSGNNDLINEVCNLNKSEFDTVRVAAAAIMCQCHKSFHGEVVGVFTDVPLLTGASELLKYYYCELLAQSYSDFSFEEKEQVLSSILQVKPNREEKYYDSDHQKYDIAITYIDRLKYRYLSAIPDQQLRAEFPNIYKKKQELYRKFGEVENTLPIRVIVKGGWSSVGTDAGKKMTEEQWLKSMRKYISDSHHDFDYPTLTGQCDLFQNLAKEDPVKCINIINQSFDDARIPREYIIAGLKGLFEIEYDINLCANIYERLISSVDCVALQESVPRCLMSLIRESEYFISHNALSNVMLNFLVDMVIHAPEDPKSNDENYKEPYNKGLNEIRGVACARLVSCYKYKQYEEIIFSTLESIAQSAALTTRAAILVRMAYLNSLNENRSLSLFLQLMHDYHPNLMALPVHNLNPLVYYINYGFAKLHDYFRKSIELPTTHEVTAHLLWIAYYKKKPGAEHLFRKIFEASIESQCAVFNNFLRGENRTHDLEKYEFEWVIRRLEVYDERAHRSIDNLWSSVIQTWAEHSQKIAAEAYLSNGWFTRNSHRFVEYLGELALTNPMQCLSWIQKGLKRTPAIMEESYMSNKVIEILIQAYNGLSLFSKKELDAEFAMDLLDEILMNNMNSSYLDNCMYRLDN